MSLANPFYTHGFLAATACFWEATARKPGNVHRYRDFKDTTYLDFLMSGLAIQPTLDREADFPCVGLSVWSAVADTRSVVRRNTNLGILLLIVPLTRIPLAPESNIVHGPFLFDLRAGIRDVLQRLTHRDAVHVYEAIRLANPGGLGDAPEQDVHSAPTVTLLEAMKLAADRDMIARQYANGYADVFDFGVPAFLDAFAKYGNVEAAIIDCQLRWLANFPDSLIARKKGIAAAQDVQSRVREVLRLGSLATSEGRRAGTELDRYLRSDGNKLNPGTTADLVTACLFVALRENKIQPSAPFRWDAPDWLAP